MDPISRRLVSEISKLGRMVEEHKQKEKTQEEFIQQLRQLLEGRST